jgi:hypothetical protein
MLSRDDPHDIANRKVLLAFDEIIQGRTVKRARHELRMGERDLSNLFMIALERNGFIPSTVAVADIQPGERIPAFVIDSGVAYFGWIFWEKFSNVRLRKLFGSIVRNDKGDWAVQISAQRATVLYANPALKCEMDIDNPSGL